MLRMRLRFISTARSIYIVEVWILLRCQRISGRSVRGGRDYRRSFEQEIQEEAEGGVEDERETVEENIY